MCSGLPESDLQLLQNIQRGMQITADLSRSDILLLFPRNANEVVVVAQAQPHSISSLYAASLVGKTLTSNDVPVILEAWHKCRHVHAQRDLVPSGAPLVQHVYPIRGHDRAVIALFSVEVSLIQLERHRNRHLSFRQAIEALKLMCMRGELAEAAALSPFGEWDGVLLVDAQRRITYLSGIANNLYRRLGYMEDLRGRRLSYLDTRDDAMDVAALNTRQPLEAEAQEGNRIWIRKVLPVWGPSVFSGWWSVVPRQKRPGDVRGVLIMVHDATEERLKKQELQVKTTMIQEVHHRVKNNLQGIAAMLRMEARRTKHKEALQAINEAISRILSVAVIHEFLSRDVTQTINIRDVCQRILTQSQQVAVAPGRQISLSVEGPNIYLPSQQATACALVVNELIQNALVHGFEIKKHGQVQILLADGGDQVCLEIRDDGDPLPADFRLETAKSLGLQIVRTLVQDDLHGTLAIANLENGVMATVQFPKLMLAQDLVGR
jgi:two-component sensor histidine kinase/PAS domain-containing protein